MRGTEVLLRQHLHRQFKTYWLTQGRRRVPDTGAEKLLAAKGIPVVDPKDILTPPYPRQPTLELPPHVPNQDGVPRNWSISDKLVQESQLEPCYVFDNHFCPVMGLPQAQLLTNTLVHWSLPQAVLDHATPTTPHEDDRVKEAILHAHLMDSTQSKLPRILDVINRPGWNDRIPYGIPLSRSNKTLTYQLLLLLDQMCGGVTTHRMLAENAISRVTFRHSECLMQFEHVSGFVVSSPHPLPRVAGQEEVANTEREPMPDIYPVSPFVSVLPPKTQYNMQDQYGVSVPDLYPHTVIIHNNAPRLRCNSEGFASMTLMFAFSHAAAFARMLGKSDTELENSPVVVQVVNCNRQQYQLGVLQLNTLDLTRSDRRNLFWTQPWQQLFSSCTFKAALPVLDGYNPEVFSLLKGLHMQGLAEATELTRKEKEVEKDGKGDKV
ncbi:hypothetical protein Pcinc_013041 [Petrolisthes cinctipes]|uniref:Mitochondrial ribosomal protein L37 n=1 Tax=Petrolisthes cinctipes TaxID=88211 RepID=A0AAE1KRZ8_PETCI|nr:hypothetical protein Pcinc_013041 [Petrolisthes cinctipes]